MHTHIIRNKRLWVLIAFALGFIAAESCSGGSSGGSGGCGGFATIPGGFNDAKNIERLAQIRLSEHGISFLEKNLSPIIASQMPDGLQFSIPASKGSQNILLGSIDYYVCDPTKGDGVKTGECVAGIDLCSVDLQTQTPNFLVVNALLGVHGPCTADFCAGQSCPDLVLPIRVEGILWSEFTCRAKVNLRNKPVGIPVSFKTDAFTQRTYFEIGDASLSISDSDIDFSSCSGSNIWDDIMGGLTQMIIGALKGLIVDQLNNQIDSMIKDQVGSLSCQSCKDDPTVCTAKTTCVKEECHNPSDQCVPPPLGMEGRMNVGDMLGSIAPGMQAIVDVRTIVGGGSSDPNQNPYVYANGLFLKAFGGVDSVPNACVPQTNPPPFTPPPMAPFYNVNDYDRGTGTKPFDIAIGVSDVMFDHFMWNAYNGGLLCLALDGSSITQLSSGVFSLLLPSLKTLTLGESVPLMLKMIPNAAPIMDIGHGKYETSTDADGVTTYTFKEPLIDLKVPNLTIDFYAQIYDRTTRLFSLTLDLDLAVALAFHSAADGTLQLTPVLGDLSQAFQNVRVSNKELVAESSERLEEIIPTILDMALPILTEALAKPIDLVKPSDLMGFQLIIEPEDITGILEKSPMPADCAVILTDGSGNKTADCHDFLAIFATLGFDPNAVPDSGNTNSIIRKTNETYAMLITEVNFPYQPSGAPLPGVAPRAANLDHPRSPWVVLEPSAKPARFGVVEYAWRVDGGSWSPFLKGERFRVESPRLWLLGKHKIEVISRMDGDIWTMDVTPAAIEFTVDPLPPEVSVDLTADSLLVIKASDDVTKKEDLKYSLLVNGADIPYIYTENPEFDLSAFLSNDKPTEIEVRVLDEKGNETLRRLTVEQNKEVQERGDLAIIKTVRYDDGRVKRLGGNINTTSDIAKGAEEFEPTGCFTRF